MAEPALNYDPDDEKPVTKPNLRALEEGKEQAAQHSKADPLDASSKLSSAPGKAIKRAEQSWGSAGIVAGGAAASTPNQIGEGFNPNDSTSTLGQKIKGTINDPGFRKKAFFGGGIAGGAVAGIAGLLLILVPLKVDDIVTDLENHFFLGADDALQHEENNLLERYLERYIMPGLKSCGVDVSKDCVVNITGDNPVENLYKAWHNARLENTLADDYGIELEWNKTGPHAGTYTLTSPSDGGEDIDLGADGSGLTREFNDVGEIRDAAYKALQDQTHWYQVLTRFKFRRLLQEKYGIPSCIIFCGVKDDLRNAIQTQTAAANEFIAKYVLTPLSSSDGAIAVCFFNPNCDPNSLKTTPEGADDNGNDVAETNGEAMSQPEADVRTAVDQDIGTLATEEANEAPAAEAAGEVAGETAGEVDAADDLATTLTKLENGGLSQLITEAIVSKVITALAGPEAGEAAASNVGDALPIVGQLNLAFLMVNTLAHAGPKIKALQYMVETAAAVREYMTFRTYADETKTGNVTAAEVGSFSSMLDPTPASQKAAGGTAGAEQTPLYQSIIDGKTPTAASTSTDVCANGLSPEKQTTPSLVCPEEAFGNGNSVLDSITAFFSTGCVGGGGLLGDLETIGSSAGTSPCALADAAAIWQSTIGKVFNWVGNAISGLFSLYNDIPCSTGLLGVGENLIIPGHSLYCEAKKAASALGQYIMKAFVKYFIPTPFSQNMSGGRTFDMMAAGADTAGNDYAHNGIGGKMLTPTQSAAVANDQEAVNQDEFEQESFLARVFDPASQYSLVSRVALAMPSDSIGSIFQGIVGSVMDPVGLLRGSFSLFSSTASAAATPQADPFGIPQYGYPVGSVPADPETYWDDNCGTNSTMTTDYDNSGAAADAAAAAADLDTAIGQSINTTTDPCLLIQASVGAGGGIYDQSLLSPDDLSDATGAGTTTPTPAAPVNANYYQIGDSITLGLANAGLADSLQTKGWDVSGNSIDGVANLTPEEAPATITKDSAQIGNAGTIVIELGTNDIGDDEATFAQLISNVISAIRTINSSAPIYWVNTYSSINPAYTNINKALADYSTVDNFKVIDWANEVTSNTNMYTFDTNLGVYPQGNGYTQMVAFIAAQIGAAPTQDALGGQGNAVTDALYAQSGEPAAISDIAHLFGAVGKIVSSQIRNVDYIVRTNNRWL